MSIRSATWSPTSSPPPASDCCQVRPKSVRSIEKQQVEAELAEAEAQQGRIQDLVDRLTRIGGSSVSEGEARQARFREEALRDGRPAAPFHVTRTLPKRHREITGRGSIYWVIRGTLSCRQAITAIEAVTEAVPVQDDPLQLSQVVSELTVASGMGSWVFVYWVE